VGPTGNGKEGGEGKRRDGREGEGVPECPNPELASLSLPENRTNLKIFSKIYFVYDFWTCLFQAILDCLYEL